MQSRRHFLATAAAAIGGAALSAGAWAAASTDNRPQIEVWKSASCGCCHLWVEHLERNGFKVKVNDVAGPADYREKFGMPSAYGSCHTARVQGYVLEGHVPAREIHRLLKEKPQAVGLAVPGMPVGSPGMEMGDRKDPYDVMLVGRDGKAKVFHSYR